MSQKKYDATESVHEIIGCEQSLIFFAKLMHSKPKHTSRDKGERNVTSWFAIALAEIGTKGILREKADCRQSRTAKCTDP